MAPLRKNTIQHFTHPEHSLTEYDSNTGYLCDGCKIPGIGKRYRCHGCEFDLHEYCGTCPTILSSFMHPYHSLKLVVRKPQGNRQFDRICNVCCDSVEGLFYRCEICEFDVHPLCTQLPETLRHVLHQIACTVGDKKSHIDGLKELFEDLGVVWLPVDKDNNFGIEIVFIPYLVINQAIVEAESLMDFRHDKHDKGKVKESMFNNVKGGGDRGKGKEIQQQYYKNQDSKKLSGRHGYAEKKAQAEKKGCYICGGPHSSGIVPT
uniref:DC1 domain-containing protein n=1 Tax=Nicotiana tabacum TaxID=4097 RepID=A0A1S4D0T1_TOBAC|nr:PREDICTED: uncharacterized protein LOC107824633 [Nicotiana tabacum]